MPREEQDPFFQYPQTMVTTSAGDVPLPVRIFTASSFAALFTAPMEAASELLSGTGLHPVPMVRGKALAVIACFDYRDSDVGAYREVGVALASMPQQPPSQPLALLELMRTVDRRRAGFYILDLPVTTDLSNAAGREIWGLPKFVTNIDFSLHGRDFEGRVHDQIGTGNILSLSGRAGFGAPFPPLSQVIYSRHQDRLLRTLINIKGAMQVRSGGPVSLHVGPSEHPMAERLHRLRLDGNKPLAVMYTHDYQARLNAGAVIG